MSYQEQANALLAQRGPEERVAVAARTGEAMRSYASCGDIKAAEELARQLAQDAVEMVRAAIARAVADNPYLPKDIAKRIAHDVESISVPFLEVSEVFDDAALAQLVVTLSESARAAVARRERVSAPLCQRLSEVGGRATAHALAANPGASLGEVGVRNICERFEDSHHILEAMAARDQIPLDVVETLVARVSSEARKRLMARYDMPDFIAPIVPQATAQLMLQTIRNASPASQYDHAQALHRREELCPNLIMRALRQGCLEFFEAAMAVKAGIPLENARKLTRYGGRMATARLSHKANIPASMRADIRDCVEMIVAARALDAA